MKVRAIDIQWSWRMESVPWWQVVWGCDIFINDVPVLKTIIAANMLVWGVLWLSR